MADDDGAGLAGLLAACETITKTPLAPSDDVVAEFFARYPLDVVFRLLSAVNLEPENLDAICAALSRILGTACGTALLPGAGGYAAAALASAHVQLRRLGAEQLGRLLLLTASGPHPDEARQHELQAMLVGALQDVDTGVAANAADALVSHASSQPAALAALLSADTPAGAALHEIVTTCDSPGTDGTGGGHIGTAAATTQRMRAFSLLISAGAACEGGAVQLQQSGAISGLLAQLNPADPLSCMVAMQLLQELSSHADGAAAPMLEQLLLPSLLTLLRHSDTAAGILPIAAQIVGAAAGARAPQSGGGVGSTSSGISSSSGGAAMCVDDGLDATCGAAAAAGGAVADVLAVVRSALDERGDASPELEAAALDGIGRLAHQSAVAAALLASPAAGTLLTDVARLALGRAAQPATRVPALHALAAVCGVERAADVGDASAGLLTPPAEDVLAAAVGAAVAGGAGGAGGARLASGALSSLLEQPFEELRTAAYRAVAGLALRPWFAAEVTASTSGLMERLCDARGEAGGRAVCEWRHAAVLALRGTLTQLAAAPPGSPDAILATSVPRGAADALDIAVRAGPFGAGAVGAAGSFARQRAQFVASARR